MRIIIVIMLFVSCLIMLALQAYAQDKIQVVTTLSTFGDLARTIGGERVEVSSVVPARFNPHFIEPKPSDVLRIKRCDMFIHAGLDLEPWRTALVNAASRPDVRPGGARELDMSLGVMLLEVPRTQPSRSEGDVHIFGNPHYWLDPRNALIMSKAVLEKLSEIDPSYAAAYAEREAVFSAKLTGKIREWINTLNPYAGTELVGYHNEWAYLMEFGQLRMSLFLEPKPGIPPSARHLQLLSDKMKKKGVGIIVQPSFYPRDMSDNLAARTGAEVVILAQNVGELPTATDYLSMIDYNINQLSLRLSRD